MPNPPPRGKSSADVALDAGPLFDGVAELGLVASLWVKPANFPKYTDITPGSFLRDDCRWYWTAMLAVHAAGGLTTVEATQAWLVERDKMDVVVPMVRFFREADSGNNPDYYAGIVRDKCHRRETQRKTLLLNDAVACGASAESIQALIADLAKTTAAKKGGWQPKLLSSAEFFSTDYRMEYLVSKILVRGQPFVVGGQSKTLKTSLLTELALSIGTIGQRFLGEFPVCSPGGVLLLSGESGEFTLKETGLRQAAVKGIDVANLNVTWEFSLPALSSRDDMDTLAKVIKDRGFKVAIIDPAYLCLLKGNTTTKAQDVFQMGPLLGELTRIGQETGCTMGLCHHTTKRLTSPWEAPTLEDLAMSGFTEWARQWLLVGRRERYEEGTGVHKLWLRVGGSAGHSGLYAVDIDEGRLDENFNGRKWDVAVTSAREHRQGQAEQKERRVKDNWQDSVDECTEAIGTVLKGLPDFFETKTKLEERTRRKGKAFDQALENLLGGEVVRLAKVKKSNGQKYDGYQLVSGQHSASPQVSLSGQAA